MHDDAEMGGDDGGGEAPGDDARAAAEQKARLAVFRDRQAAALPATASASASAPHGSAPSKAAAYAAAAAADRPRCANGVDYFTQEPFTERQKRDLVTLYHVPDALWSQFDDETFVKEPALARRGVPFPLTGTHVVDMRRPLGEWATKMLRGLTQNGHCFARKALVKFVFDHDRAVYALDPHGELDWGDRYHRLPLPAVHIDAQSAEMLDHRADELPLEWVGKTTDYVLVPQHFPRLSSPADLRVGRLHGERALVYQLVALPRGILIDPFASEYARNCTAALLAALAHEALGARLHNLCVEDAAAASRGPVRVEIERLVRWQNSLPWLNAGLLLLAHPAHMDDEHVRPLLHRLAALAELPVNLALPLAMDDSVKASWTENLRALHSVEYTQRREVRFRTRAEQLDSKDAELSVLRRRLLAAGLAADVSDTQRDAAAAALRPAPATSDFSSDGDSDDGD